MKTALLTVLIHLLVTTVKGHGKHVRHRAAAELFSDESNSTIDNQQVNDEAPCGVQEVTDEIRQGGKLALDVYQFKMASEDKDSYSNVFARVIPVCFHVIGKKIARKQLSGQLAALNKAYSGSSCCDPSQSWCVQGTCSPNTNIRFVMAKVFMRRIWGTTDSPRNLGACVKRYRKDVNLEDEQAFLKVQRRKRVGDARILNIYFGNMSTKLGYATYPVEYKSNPIKDGVVVGRNYIVGSDMATRNEGDTLAHQVGHWLGLYHTFAGGCSLGDQIEDTPAEAVGNTGCNPSVRRDTCPNNTGLDPIHNFMDNSADICLYTLTWDQIQVMHANIEFYRSKTTPDLPSVLLANDTWSDQYTMASGFTRRFYIDVPTTSSVRCQTVAAGGNINLFMNWDTSFSVFDCSSEKEGSWETCEIGPNTGVANGRIYSKETTAQFQIRCRLL